MIEYMCYGVELALCVVAAATTHELGHYAVARYLGQSISFRFEWGWLGIVPIPRGLWYMPDIERWKQRTIALGGFTLEIALAILLKSVFGTAFLCYYLTVTLVHLFLYPFYAGGASDFKWL